MIINYIIQCNLGKKECEERKKIKRISLDKFKDNKTDPWATVTGGRDGIGRGYVEELLSRDFNVIVHGRSEEKLAKLQAELQTEYSNNGLGAVVITKKIYGLDFTQTNPPDERRRRRK
jgi:FlaA1/EpsC-like NDP-sugar epimerase